ncbi:MAG: hypothetical protein ACHQQQ_08695 [Bacteroidota bacterium]
MDFVNDLRKIAENELDYYGLTHSPIENFITVLKRWINLRLMLIKPVPRKVFISRELQSNTSLSTQEQLYLEAVNDKFVRGIDINRHLSTRVFRKDYPDYLFIDWGIHHLHLNTIADLKDPTFIKRSEKLLFVMVNGTKVFFIDVRSHTERYVFAQKALLQIIHVNWPEIIRRYRINAISVEKEFSAKETHEMRKAGCMITHKMGDAVYISPGGGVTSAATSVRVVDHSDRLISVARDTEKWANDSHRTILEQVQKVDQNQTKVDLHLDLNEKGFFVVDVISKTGWNIKTQLSCNI